MITSTTNQRVKWVRSLQLKRSQRRDDGMFVIEGTRLIQEANNVGQRIRLILHTEEWATDHPRILAQLSQVANEVELVTPAVLSSCSDVETPQGVLAVVPITQYKPTNSWSLVLLLDRLSDPGNLGTVLRTSVAAGVECVYLTPGSVDLYNPKVVRSGMGAHFHLNMQEISWDDLPARIDGLELWLAEAGEGVEYHQVNWRTPVVLAIGSEARGLAPLLETFASGKVHIPMASGTESLNAATAAAVLLFEIRRQRDN
jgi:TrmH family RNA methyltransferase